MRRLLLKLFRRPRLEADLEAELAFHRELAAAGGNPVPFGSTLRTKEQARDLWRFRVLEDSWQDVRQASSALARQPAFTLFTLFALVTGIGLNVVPFTAFNSLAWTPWPVPDPAQVVLFGNRHFSLHEYRDLGDQLRTLESLVLEDGPAPVDLDGSPRLAEFVSANYFEALRVGMVRGRAFLPHDDRAGASEPVAVLAYSVWRTQYGSDPGIVGRQVRVNDATFTVVGVADERFTGGFWPAGVWAPFGSRPLVIPRAGEPAGQIAARMAPGVSLAQAQAELDVIVPRLGRTGSPVTDRHEIVLRGTRRVDSGNARGIVSSFVFAQMAAGAMLLLACANVGNLMLARAMSRTREIGVRLSLGAGRWRIVRQLMAEGLLLASAATAVVLVILSAWSEHVRLNPGPVVSEGGGTTVPLPLSIDIRVMAYSLVTAGVAMAICSLAPALRATRGGLMAAMRDQNAQATARSALRSTLLALQVAISVTALVCAALLARAVWRVSTADLGFAKEGVSVLAVQLEWEEYNRTGAAPLVEQIRDRLRPLGPVGFAAAAPPDRLERTTVILPPRGAALEEEALVAYTSADAGFFEVLQIPLLAGRSFLPEDRDRSVVLINEAMARRYWRGASPVGSTLRYVPDSDARVTPNGRGLPAEPRAPRDAEIIGVVRDAQLTWPEPMGPAFFQFHRAEQQSFRVLVPGPSADVAAGMIPQLSPESRTTTTELSKRIGAQLEGAAGLTRVASGLGLLALVLATVGVYGVASYSVEQRRREIGIRMAMGARPRAVVGIALLDNARPLLAGLAIGLGLSMAASTALEGSLYGLSRLDPVAYAGVLSLLCAAGAAASAIPARRATRIDPARVLHAE